MKRKFLAKAITLGLMLAVPFGVDAAYTPTVDGNNLTYNLTGKISTIANLGITAGDEGAVDKYQDSEINDLKLTTSINNDVIGASTNGFNSHVNGTFSLDVSKDNHYNAVLVGGNCKLNINAKNISINNSGHQGVLISPTGANAKLHATDTITVSAKNSAIKTNGSNTANSMLYISADKINIISADMIGLDVGTKTTVNIDANNINISGKFVYKEKESIINYGTLNINQNTNKEDIKDSSKITINNGINNYGTVNAIAGAIEFTCDDNYDLNGNEPQLIFYDKAGSATNLTATKGNITVSSNNNTVANGLQFSGTANINANKGTFKIDVNERALRVGGGGYVTINAKTIDFKAATSAINAYSGGKLFINSDDVIVNSSNLEGNDAFNMGVCSSGGSTIEINANNIDINAGISVKSDEGKTTSSIKIDATNKINIKGDIKTVGENATQNNVGGDLTIGSDKSNAKINIEGNIYRGQLKDNDGNTITQGEGGSVNIILNNKNSSLTGNIYDNDATDGDAGKVQLEVKNGATWTTTGDSTVKEVTSDGGVIAVKGDGQKVEIKNLKGTDTTINTDSINNKLTIGNNETKLDVKASKEVTDSLGNDIQGGMEKLLDNIDVKEGTKETTVTAAAGSVTGETTITRDADGNSSSATEKVNKDNAGISEMASIGLMAWRAENNDMNKRLGELRSSQGEHGVWTRMVRGQSKYGAQNVKNQYSTYQLGYDEKLSVNKHWTVGAAVSYTDASSSFTTGHGENKSTGLAVYGSYLGDNGSFVDLIAKVARLKNEFDVLGGAGKGDYETNGYSISAEYGKRFTKDNGFWIEPQIELTYGYVGAVDYLTSNDVSVRQNGMDSLVGRIGFSLGRDIKAGNVYARASYLYDFDGETDVTFSKNGAVRGYKQDLGGSWWEVGVGTNINLSDATHLYFDVEKTYGGNVATPWQWNAGVRWSF